MSLYQILKPNRKYKNLMKVVDETLDDYEPIIWLNKQVDERFDKKQNKQFNKEIEKQMKEALEHQVRKADCLLQIYNNAYEKYKYWNWWD